MTDHKFRVTADDPIEKWRASGVAYFENRAHGEVGEWWLNQIRHIFGAESLAAVRIERPVPTNDMTAMSHETTGFCFCGQMHGQVKDWNEHDWAALRTHAPSGAMSHPSVPTREQIAGVADELEYRVRTAVAIAIGAERTATDRSRVIDAEIQDGRERVLALLQKDGERDPHALPCPRCDGSGVIYRPTKQEGGER